MPEYSKKKRKSQQVYFFSILLSRFSCKWIIRKRIAAVRNEKNKPNDFPACSETLQKTPRRPPCAGAARKNPEVARLFF